MGGLSSGPGPGICFLALCLLFLAQQTQSAPVQEDNLSLQSRAQGYYDGSSSELSSGCYYNFQHYGEGDRIITNEPCLNCTCRNRMLMCYLRVCPFTKAIGQNCTIEKKPGQCCPLIICPEVPVQLLTSSTTTEHSESMSHKTQLGYVHHGTGVGHLDDYGCRINGEFYTNGAQIPGNIDKPCEVCYCIRNRTACIMQECTLQVEGCIPVYEEGLCCPVRYQCDYDYNYNALTTEEPRPTPGLVLTTTSGPFECQHDGKWYADGSSVDTEDPCEHCYCMKGDIVCAVQECKPPFEKDGHNCTAMPPAPGKCCPDSYHCDGKEIVAASETTFRQDRMHKFGRNNANVTMSITSSTSSSDKHHGWNYGTNANNKDTPNRFTDEQNKDGTTDTEGHMMITEGIPPTLGPLESGSHHLEGHNEGKPASEGHGVNTDNMLTISQVIQNIVHNQTQLLNQNRLNQSMDGSGKPVKHPGGVVQDDKIHSPIGQGEDNKRPPFHHMQTDEDGNPLESPSTMTELPEDYYGFTGGSSDIYSDHSGRPQTRPSRPSGKPQPGQATFGEHGHFGRPIKRPGSGSVSSGEHEGNDKDQGITDLPEGFISQPGKRPIMHKVPGTVETSDMTDEMGNRIEGMTDLPEGITGKPGTVYISYDEHGRPHSRPIGHKRPGMTGSDEGVTDVYEGVTELQQSFIGGPGSIGTYVNYDKHGQPHKRPTTDDETSTEGFTGKPGVHGLDEGVTGSAGEYTRRPGDIHGVPGIHTQPGMEDGITEIYEGTTEMSEGFTGHYGQGMYGEYGHGGRPQKRPGLTEGVTNKDGTIVEGVMKMPGHYGTSDIFGEHGRPQEPTYGSDGMKITLGEVEGMTKAPEVHTGIYESYDEHGRPKPTILKKPGQVTTDENGSSVEAATGSPEYFTGRPNNEEMEIVYDKYGRPHRRPVHKKPGMDGEVTTAEYEHEGDAETLAHTETSELVIMYDHQGRPIKTPVHKTPGMHTEFTSTDKDEKPVEGVTEQTGHTGEADYMIFYDQFGQPHKMPVDHKRPGIQVLTDVNGKPLEGQENFTQTSEGFTGKPDDNDYTIVYDSHGRPVKRPTPKPGTDHEQTSTNKYGKPIYGITEIPEGHSGTPIGDDMETVYDENGRPFQPTNVHKKPGIGDDDITEEYSGTTESQFMIVYDQHGRPIKKPIRKKPGVHGEQIPTETPESHTGTPNGEDEQTVYDQHGRPVKRPILAKPGVHEDYTDKYGKPVEGMTETPESQTGQPDGDQVQPVYDQFGRPVKRPIHTKPDMDEITTDEYGKPVGETLEGQIGGETPGIFGEHGHTGSSHKKPVQGPVGVKVTTDEMDGTTEAPEAHTDRPDGEVHYDQYGRPKPSVHTKPFEGQDLMTEPPGGQTGKPESDSFIIFFDKYGRPHRRPIHEKPGSINSVLTDEQGNPPKEITESPTNFPDKPETPGFFGEYGHTGRPHKRPGPIGEENQTEEYEGTTGIPEIYGEHGHTGRPYKRPVIHKKPGMHDGEKEGTDSSEDHRPVAQKKPVTTGADDLSDTVTDKPEDGLGTTGGHPVYGKPGRPSTSDGEGYTEEPHGVTEMSGSTDHNYIQPVKTSVTKKRPQGTHDISEDEISTDVYGTTEMSEAYTTHPLLGENDHEGRPQHKPSGQNHQTIQAVSSTSSTDITEGVFGTEVYYDEHGRPMVHKKPGEVATDEDGNPLEEHEGTPQTPGDHTPEFIIVYDKHNRPIKKPIRKRPGVHDQQYVEGLTETPEGQTGTPDSDDEVFYDKYGNPIQPGIVHKKPGMDGVNVMTDENGNEHDVTTEIAEDHTDTSVFMIVFDKNGRPIKKPIRKKPGMHGEHMATDKYGKPVEGMTEAPENHTSTLDNDDEVFYDKYGRPTGVHSKPDIDVVHTQTDKMGKPVYGTTETPESDNIETDEHGRPVVHKKPDVDGEPKPTEEYDQPVESTTEPQKDYTEKPDFVIMYDNHGRPIKMPVHKTPGIYGEYKPTDEHRIPLEGMTEQTEDHSGEPDYVIFYDQFGRPHKMPVGHRPVLTDGTGKPVDGGGQTGKPDSEDVTTDYDEHGQTVKPTTDEKKPGMPEEDGTTHEHTEDHIGTPDFMIVYDQYGRPIKKPIHKTPVVDNDHSTTDKYGKPFEGLTETPEDHTDIPDDIQTIQHVRPVSSKPMEAGTETTEGPTGSTENDDKKPDPSGQPAHTKPDMDEITTDEYGKPIGETPEGQIGGETPEIFGEHGHTGPSHKKPVQGPVGVKVTTDEMDGTTEAPEAHTDRPDGEVHYDQHGRPKPGVQKKPDMDEIGKPVEEQGATTETIAGHTGTPDSNDELFYNKYGKPIRPGVLHKKPGMAEDDVTDEGGKPLDENEASSETAGDHTDIPAFIAVYDKNGRPIKKPVTKRPGEYTSTDQYGKPVEGMTEAPEDNTGITDSDDEVFYDKYGNPIKLGTIHKKPGIGDDDITEEYSGTTESQFMIVYDQHGRPIKKPIRKKPGVHGEQIPTETPESHTGTPNGEDEQTVYDQHGRPVKRPILAKPGVHDDYTDKYGKPVEGMTETPESQTGQPDGDQVQPVYDQFGRPVKRPIHTKPDMDEITTDEYGKPVGETPEGQTGGETPGIFGEHGHTGPSHKKPVQGPVGVKVTTDEMDGTTEAPEAHTDRPDGEVHYDQYGRPKPVVHKQPEITADDDEKPVDGLVEAPGGQVNRPDNEGSTVGVDENAKPQENPIDEHGYPMEHSTTGKPGAEHDRPHGKPDDVGKLPVHEYEVLTILPEHHTIIPESDSHHVMPDSHDQTKPQLVDDEMGSTSQPHLTQKTPGVSDVVIPEEGMEIPDDHTGKPGSDTESHPRPASQDNEGSASPVTHDKEGQPHEGSITYDPHTRPQDVVEHSTGVHVSVTEAPHEALKPQNEPEDTQEAEKKPGTDDDHVTETPKDGLTGKPEEIFYDESGRPHKRPSQTQTDDVHNEVPDVITGKPEQDGFFGEPGHTGRPYKRPISKPGTDEIHTTDIPEGPVHYDEYGRPVKKPVASGDVLATEEPDSDASSGTTEPQLFGESGRPHKKPIRKPVSGGTEDSDHDQKQSGVGDYTGVYEEESTSKPDHDSAITHFGENGKTTKKPVKPAHDQDEERPEQNEIFEGEKVADVSEGEHVTDKPEDTKVGEPINGVGEDTEESTTGLPETWQYLPPKKPDIHRQPEVDTNNKPQVKPIQTTERYPEENDDDEDESLIVTTDEPEEETENAHDHADEETLDIKTKVPDGSTKPHDKVHPTTPGLGSPTHDFTTPGYGAHDSSLPVTDGATHGHPVTQGVDGQPNLSQMGPDGVSFPGANVVFDKDGKPHIIPGQHGEFTPTPGYEDEVQPQKGDESHDTTMTQLAGASGPEDESTSGTTIVFGEDGKPHIVQPQETISDVKGKPVSGQPEEGKPVNIPTADSTEKIPSRIPGIPGGFLPSFGSTGTPNTDAPIMIDGGLNEGSPFDAVLDSLANVLRPIHTTEKAAETTEAHEEVPGEGSCFMDGVTYPNNSDVPPLSPCHTKCTCISSIIHCLSLKCPSPPEDVSHCTTVHDEKSCCPTYICDETSASSAEGQEMTTVQEGEHGQVVTEASEDEEGQHTPSKTGTQHSNMDTEKPEEYSPTMKPEVNYAHPDDHEGEPKPSGMIPAGIEVSTGDFDKPAENHTPKQPEEITHVKPGQPHRPQSGYFPTSSDEHHSSTALPSYFGTGKPITAVEKQPDHQKPDSTDLVLGTEEPTTEDKKPGHKEQPIVTDDHKPHEGMGKPETPTEVTGEEATMPDNHLLMKEPEQHKPSTTEGLPEEEKPHQTITSDHHEESAMKPHEKPDESSPTKVPEDSHKPLPTGDKIGDDATHKPDGGITLSEKHKKPGSISSSMDEKTVSTTTSPQERPAESEEPIAEVEKVEHSKPDHTGEEHQGKPHVKPDTDSSSTAMPEPIHSTSKIPMIHDITSEEDKDHIQTMTTDQTEEPGHAFTPVAASEQPEETYPGYESTDKVHPNTNQSESHYKEPESTTSEDMTMTPDQFATGDPMTPSGIFADSQKKPEDNAPESHKPSHGITEISHHHSEDEEPHGEDEAPQKPDDGERPTSEESGHKTTRPYGQPSEEMEGKPETGVPPLESASVGPSGEPTIDVENAHTPQTGEDSFHTMGTLPEDNQKPYAKPEVSSHSTSTDEKVSHFTTTKPHGEPTSDAGQSYPSIMDEEFSHTTTGSYEHESVVEELHKIPEDDLMHPSSEGPGSGASHSTTVGVNVQQEHDFGSTLGSRPEQSTPGHLTEKSKPEEIPDEVFSLPTRTPGTFQTQRPDMELEGETTENQPEKPMVDESLTTFFPEEIFRPVTKRPTFGANKPENSMTQQPQTERPESTGKPMYDVTTDDLSGSFRPKPDFDDLLSSTGIYQKPDYIKPDEDLEEHEATPHEEYTTTAPGLKPGSVKRPIYSTNGTHFIKYIPFSEGEAPKVPQGAMLGEPEERPDGEKYWPIIFVKPGVVTTEPTTTTEKPKLQQIFNGTHFIQYVPYEDGEKPEVPQDATLGQPIRKPDGQVYWPIIDIKPLSSSPVEEPVTQEPFPGQIFNGTHFIQYVPYDEGKPEVPEGAILGQPQIASNGEKYWPIISTRPIPDEEGTTAGTIESQPEQIFNGTHFIQYVPFKDGEAPEIPEDATLGQPQKGPDGQIYWPIINTKPILSEEEPEFHFPPVQVFNGSNFIQYVPTKDGEIPEVPEGATLGQPQKTPDGEIYWPIIYAKPQPVKPELSLPSQVFNGTHYIQYVPYEENKKPEVPEGAILGQPQRTPDGQTLWPLIYTKLVTTKPEEEPVTTQKPLSAYLFNGTHHIQYVPFEEGKEPEVPDGAILGQPQKTPDGQTFWPLIFSKPAVSKPEDEPMTTQKPTAAYLFNGTHHIQYVPFEEGKEPEIPQGATLGQPQRTPDGQTFWPLIFSKPTTPTPEDELVTTEEPFVTQLFNGTHYIQYIPFTEGFEPQLPEEATLGEPLTRPDGQKYWPIIYEKLPTMDKPEEIQPQLGQVYNGTHFIKYVPYRPNYRPQVPEDATIGQPVKGADDQMFLPIVSTKPLLDIEEEPVKPEVFNGTHYIQYVPYKPGQRPVTPEGAILGNPTKGQNDELYWPVIYQKPAPDLPITTLEPFEESEPSNLPINIQFHNGTHFIQYVPYKPGKRPVVPEDAMLGKPVRRPDNQLYWPVIYMKPVEGLPIVTQHEPVEDDLPTTETVSEQYFNGTHYIQYVPYKPGHRPVIPNDATLGNPTRGPNNQMYWPIIYLKPVPGLPITTQAELYEDNATGEPVTQQYYNGSHYIQYVPYKPGQRPVIPEGATLGKPTKAPNDELFWPIIYEKPIPGLPITTQSGPYGGIPTTSQIRGQVFNGTHYIQYVPFEHDHRPLIPEGATLGKPIQGPNGQMYNLIIDTKPFPGVPIATEEEIFQDKDTTTEPVIIQVFNGTHQIHYIPYKPGQRPVIPEEAILRNLTKGPNDQMYWPVIYPTPASGLPVITQQQYDDGIMLEDPTKGQLFNGTHYIQYVPYRPTHRPVIPPDAKLGTPMRGPNGQMYWPIIHFKPVPGIPIVSEKLFQQTPERGQYFNGTHYIQYVPYTAGHRPVVPEGAILGHPEVKSDGKKYWPIIRSRPAPGIPINWMSYEYTSPEPEQIFNGTHHIQYLPYNPTQMPEVPEGAILGHAQKGPGGQMYWVIISDKPIPSQTFNGTHVVQYVTPVTPEQDSPDEHRPNKPLQVFNGTHYIQYVPYTPGQQPVVPEGAILGKPTKGPEGEKYWPIIYKKRPVGEVSSMSIPQDDQIFNGTHFIRYVPFNPNRRPIVPEGATLSLPQRGSDGQTYWVISSNKPLPVVNDETVSIPAGQTYNGTHYIQYVPYNPSQMPQVPEGAVLGHPQEGPEGQMNWVIISEKPLPVQPGTQYVQYVTPVTPEDSKFTQGLIHNGTHYIQYVPYKPAQIPHIPNEATLGDLEQGPGGQMYWPIIFSKLPQGPIFNGTHYVIFAPQNSTNIENSTKDHPFWDYGQYGGTKVKPSTTEGYPTWSKPEQNATKEPSKPGYEYESGYKPDKRPSGEDSYETIDEDHLIEYPSGSDYDENQEQPYGPGTCRYAGKVYVSAQQIPRDDPCDFCFCFRSDIICLQQSCPPPIPGCHEEPIQGFCCPRYECHVRMATLLNVTSTTTTTTTTLPPHFLSHVYNGAAGRTGCFVQGKAYRVGQPIASASGPCMDCICGGDGKMKCEPKVCTPEPMVRKMMVSTEKATTANHR